MDRLDVRIKSVLCTEKHETASNRGLRTKKSCKEFKRPTKEMADLAHKLAQGAQPYSGHK